MDIKIQQIHIQYMTCIPYVSLSPFLQIGLCFGVLFVCFRDWGGFFSVLIDAELMLFLSTATVVAVQS